MFSSAELENKPIGTFLIRESSIKPHYTVMFVGPDRKVAKALLRNDNGVYQLDEPGSRSFNSLNDVINAHSTILKAPFKN
jgi:hypothetical protein